jgi:hypothetical protein
MGTCSSEWCTRHGAAAVMDGRATCTNAAATAACYRGVATTSGATSSSARAAGASSSRVAVPTRTARYRDGVGFNPFRQQVKRRSDIVLVGVAFAVIVLLVLWAAFGS